jgi:hypothetical protein
MAGGGRQAGFGSREVGRILERALKLQDEERRQLPATTAHGDSTSLAELEELGREVGVEPALVRRAAAELETQPRPVETTPWLGVPERIVYERNLPGEATPEALEALVGVLEEVLGEPGQASMVGRTFTWTSFGAEGRRGPHGRQISIVIASRDGTTSLRVEERLRPTAGNKFRGLVGGISGTGTSLAMGVGMGALHSPLAAVIFSLVALGGAVGSARALYRRTVARRTEELGQLVARIALELETKRG